MSPTTDTQDAEREAVREEARNELLRYMYTADLPAEVGSLPPEPVEGLKDEAAKVTP